MKMPTLFLSALMAGGLLLFPMKARAGTVSLLYKTINAVDAGYNNNSGTANFFINGVTEERGFVLTTIENIDLAANPNPGILVDQCRDSAKEVLMKGNQFDLRVEVIDGNDNGADAVGINLSNNPNGRMRCQLVPESRGKP